MDDDELMSQLRAETDTDAFIEAMVRLGTERGYRFDGEDVREALWSSRSEWSRRKSL
jgi:hypothetical protein